MKPKLKGLAGLVNEQAELAKLPEVKVQEIPPQLVPKSYEEMGEMIYLDLEKTVFYCSHGANRYKVNAIKRGIQAGDEFPPVFVSENPDGSYSIAFVEDPFDRTNYSGNHRAAAHYEAKKPLKCIKVSGTVRKADTKLPVSCIHPYKDRLAIKEYKRTKEYDSRYR